MNPSAAKLRVALADRLPAARASLRQLVEGPWGWEVVAEAGDGFEAVRLARANGADVLLVDTNVGGLGVTEIRELLSASEIVVVGLLERPEQHAAQTGPSALKSVGGDTLRVRIEAALHDRWAGPVTVADAGAS